MATDEQIFREAEKPVLHQNTCEDFLRSLLTQDARLIKLFNAASINLSVYDVDTALDVVRARASVVVKLIAEEEGAIAQ